MFENRADSARQGGFRAALVALAAGVSGAALLAGGAFAQTGEGAPAEEAAAENGAAAAAEAADDVILVWGTRVSANTLYLGEHELALRQADHLSDLLRQVPGVEIGGTHSTNARISFRGVDDRDLSVYIDGALQTNYLYHHLGNLLINPDILRSADIQLGANSVVYGGRGGAVRFETRDAGDLLAYSDRPFGARLMGSYHDNAQTSFSLTGYGELGGRFDVLGYVYRVDRDNFEDGDGRETIGSDGETDNYLFKVGFNADARNRFELSYDLFQDGGDYTQRPDMGVLTNAAITGDILLPTEYDRETINASYRLDLGEALQLDATYYTNDLRLWRDETNVGALIREAEADNQGVNVLARSTWRHGAVSHAFTYGLEYFDQNLAYVSDVEAGAAPIEQEVETLAFFIEDEINVADRLVLRPGARFNSYELTYAETGDTGSWDEPVFALAGELFLAEGLSLQASWSELFRGPELAEPFIGLGANKIVNPDLEPETGDHIEAGFRYTTDLGGAGLHVGLNVFRTELDDYIDEVDVPGTTTGETWDDNLGTAVIEGYEASANLVVGNWDLLGSFSSWEFDPSGLDSASLAADFREVGDTWAFEASYQFDAPNILVSWSGQVVEDLVTSQGAERPGYTVHNLSARWIEPFGAAGLTVNAGVDNLFDETYTSHASRIGATNHPVFGALVLNDVEPGRNIKITISQVF